MDLARIMNRTAQPVPTPSKQLQVVLATGTKGAVEAGKNILRRGLAKASEELEETAERLRRLQIH